MKKLYFGMLLIWGCISDNQTHRTSAVAEQPKVDSAFNSKTPVTVRVPEKKISQRDKVLTEAVGLSNAFYNNLKVQNYAGACKHLHPDALAETPVSEWIKIYTKAQDRTGSLSFVNMVAHGAKCGIEGGNGKGDYAELIFDTQYKEGNLREKLIFYRKDSTEVLKILGYEYHAILDRVKLSKILEE